MNLSGGAETTTEAEKRLRRLEELRRDLFGDKPAPAEYALNTLLSMLWLEADVARLAVACALSDAPPSLGKAEAPAFAARLCYRQQAPAADPLAVPSLSPALPPKGAKLAAWAEEMIVAIFADALNALKQMLNQPTCPETQFLAREAQVCEAALRLGTRLKSPTLVEPALRLLRLLASEPTRDNRLPQLPEVWRAQQAPQLLARAGQFLAAMPPDDLPVLWDTLNGSNAALRHALLPALDFLTDARAVPHLLYLLERHGQWPDNSDAAWASLRVLQRLQDRRPACPAPPDRACRASVQCPAARPPPAGS